MTKLLQKTAASVLSLGLLTSALVPFAGVSANSKTDPKIRHISNVTARSVVLNVEYKSLKKRDVFVRVQIRNVGTGEKMTKTYSTHLNSKGRSSVTVRGLKPGVQYAFKVKVRKTTMTSYSDYSNTKKATTTRLTVVPAKSGESSSGDSSSNQ